MAFCGNDDLFTSLNAVEHSATTLACSQSHALLVGSLGRIADPSQYMQFGASLGMSEASKNGTGQSILM